MFEKKILLVEDEGIVALDIKADLETLGYRVCGIASAGREALEMVRNTNPDLVLMDIRLKGEMDGITAAAIIRDLYCTPVVYLTAHADEHTLKRALVTEPFGYLVKPFQTIELRVAIEMAFHRHRELRDESATSTEGPRADTQVVRGRDGFERIIALLKKTFPLNRLSADSMEDFASSCILSQCHPGQLLIFEGDVRDKGFLVLSGRIALLKTSISGKELIVETLLPGELFGLAIALEEQAYTFTARAQIATTLLYVPRSALMQLLRVHPELYRFFVNSISERLNRAHVVAKALAHDRVEKRIAAALNELIAGASNDELPRPEIRITRQELADLTGTTVETAIRVTKALERDTILDLSQNGLVRVSDPTQLEKLSAN